MYSPSETAVLQRQNKTQNMNTIPLARQSSFRSAQLKALTTKYGLPPIPHSERDHKNNAPPTPIQTKNLSDLKRARDDWNNNVPPREFQAAAHKALQNHNHNNTPLPHEITVIESCDKNTPTFCFYSELDPALHGKMLATLNHVNKQLTDICQKIHDDPHNVNLRTNWYNITNTTIAWHKSASSTHNRITLHPDFENILLPVTYLPFNMLGNHKAQSANMRDPLFTNIHALVRDFARRGTLPEATTSTTSDTFRLHTARAVIPNKLLITNVHLDDYFRKTCPNAAKTLDAETKHSNKYHPAFVPDYEKASEEDRNRALPRKNLVIYVCSDHGEGEGRFFTSEIEARIYISGKHIHHKRVLKTPQGLTQGYLWALFPFALTPMDSDTPINVLRPQSDLLCQECLTLIPPNTALHLPPIIIDNKIHSAPPDPQKVFCFVPCLHPICDICLKKITTANTFSSLANIPSAAMYACPGRDSSACQKQGKCTLDRMYTYNTPIIPQQERMEAAAGDLPNLQNFIKQAESMTKDEIAAIFEQKRSEKNTKKQNKKDKKRREQEQENIRKELKEQEEKVMLLAKMQKWIEETSDASDVESPAEKVSGKSPIEEPGKQKAEISRTRTESLHHRGGCHRQRLSGSRAHIQQG